MYKARKAHGDKVDPGQRHAVVPARRQDRRGRSQRRRQVQRAADHGRRRHALQRRGHPLAGLHGRLPRAGAAPRREQDRPSRTSRTASRTRSGCSTGSTRSPRRSPTLTPTTTRCSPRWATCRNSSTTGRPGTSTPSSSRPWTRCAARRRRRRRASCPAASGAASRCASCCCRRPTCCSSTSPPTTSTPSRSSGSSSTSRSTRAPWSRSPTTGTSSTTSPSGSSSSTADVPTPYEGNYSTYLETKQSRLKVEGRRTSSARSACARSLSGCGPAPRADRPRARPDSHATRRWPPRRRRARKLDFEEIQIPPGPRLGSVVVETDHLTKGFDDRLLIDDLSLLAAAQRDRRA